MNLKNINKSKLVLSTLLTLLPALLVTMLSTIMPVDGAPMWMLDGEGNLNILTMLMPVIIISVADPILLVLVEKTNEERNTEMKNIVYLILPLVSLVACYVYSAYAFGFDTDNEKLLIMLFSVLFIVIGNYLPKCTRSTTLGIKVKWALENGANWTATHRFTGRLWVGGGFLMAIFSFVPGDFGIYAFIAIVLLLALIPVLYSYVFYRKQMKDGTYTAEISPKASRRLRIFSTGMIIVLCVVLMVLLFGGNIDYRFRNHHLEIDSSFFADSELRYAEVADMELVDHRLPSRRVMGLGTVRLACGTFRSDELGDFTSYRYAGTDNAIVIRKTDGEVLVLSGRDEKATEDLYLELKERI